MGMNLGKLSVCLTMAFTLRRGHGWTLPDITSRYLQIPRNDSAAEHLLYLTRRSHIAGSEADHDNALFVASKLKEFGFDEVSIPEYEILLSYPTDQRSLKGSLPEGSWSYEAVLKEPAFPDGPYSSDPQATPTYNAFSASGNVTGEVVYAGYGRQEDYQLLREAGVDVKGALVMARYGKIYRGDIAWNAALEGAAGVLIFSDPMDYNPSKGFDGQEGAYPDGPGLPLHGVQRGSVIPGSGDPLTPGWPSARVDRGVRSERVPMDDPVTGLVPIPVQPISAADALPLLERMDGKTASGDWVGGLGDNVYKVGRGPVRAHLDLVVDTHNAVIWNVVGVIHGSEEPDRYVILGNHRDAWVFGAVDPNSGTASMLEVGRALGVLKAQGWRPRRSIVLCSWDAEEHNLGGSTEWAEDHELLLMQRAVAYLNTDCAVSGPGPFWAGATPSLDDVVIEATRQVPDPAGRARNLHEAWGAGPERAQLQRLGDDGSDHAAFVQHLGIPATAVGFESWYPVYHSVYDNFRWMERFGDPGFHRHVAVAQVWGLIALRLAEEPVLPLDYTRYASVLAGYIEDLKVQLDGSNVDLSPLYEAHARLVIAAAHVTIEIQVLSSLGDPLRTRELNDRLMLAERGFLDAAGLQGEGEAAYRRWLKHLVYSPPQHNAYGQSVFPGIVDACQYASHNETVHAWASVQHEVWRVARALDRVAGVLRGGIL